MANERITENIERANGLQYSHIVLSLLIKNGMDRFYAMDLVKDIAKHSRESSINFLKCRLAKIELSLIHNS